MTAIADAHPGAAVEVWCQDEARYGLIPTQRRVWAPRGKRPTCSSRRRYQWSYLYGFVHPASGSLLPYILPLVNRDAFRISLELFAIDADAGPHRQIVLVVDGAGWHHAAEAAGEIPEHVHLVYLPPYSPSYSLANVSGRWRMRPSPTAASMTSTISTARSPRGAVS